MVSSSDIQRQEYPVTSKGLFEQIHFLNVKIGRLCFEIWQPSKEPQSKRLRTTVLVLRNQLFGVQLSTFLLAGVICGRRDANGVTNITEGICIGGDIPSKVYTFFPATILKS